MFGTTRKLPGGSAAVIGGLGILILGAIAFALPQPAISAGDRGGYLVAHSQLSGQFAEQLARTEYGFVVVDLTEANLDKEAFWRMQLAGIGKRRYPVWGWVNVTGGLDHAREVLSTVSVAGLYVYGDDSVAAAAALRAARPGLPILPVIGADETPPADSAYAITLDKDAFAGEIADRATPVLLAARLSESDIMDARDKRGAERYVIAQPVLVR